MGLREIAEHLEAIERKVRPERGTVIYASENGPHPQRTALLLGHTGEVTAVENRELLHPDQDPGSTVGVAHIRVLGEWKIVPYFHKEFFTEKTFGPEFRGPERELRTRYRSTHLMVYKTGDSYTVDVYSEHGGEILKALLLGRMKEMPKPEQVEFPPEISIKEVSLEEENGSPVLRVQESAENSVGSEVPTHLDEELRWIIHLAKARLGINRVRASVTLRRFEQEFQGAFKSPSGEARVFDFERKDRTIPIVSINLQTKEGVKPDERHEQFINLLREALWNRAVGDEDGFRKALEKLKKLIGG